MVGDNDSTDSRVRELHALRTKSTQQMWQERHTEDFGETEKYLTPIKSQDAIWLFTHNNFNQHCNPIKSDFSSRIFTVTMYNSLQKKKCNCSLSINNTDTYL